MSFPVLLVFGLVVGLVARAIMPGGQRLGWLATMLWGVVGSFVGGFVGALLTSSHRVLDFDTASLFGSVLGALLALAIGEASGARQRTSTGRAQALALASLNLSSRRNKSSGATGFTR